jgi:hypothetical protein
MTLERKNQLEEKIYNYKEDLESKYKNFCTQLVYNDLEKFLVGLLEWMDTQGGKASENDFMQKSNLIDSKFQVIFDVVNREQL